MKKEKKAAQNEVKVAEVLAEREKEVATANENDELTDSSFLSSDPSPPGTPAKQSDLNPQQQQLLQPPSAMTEANETVQTGQDEGVSARNESEIRMESSEGNDELGSVDALNSQIVANNNTQQEESQNAEPDLRLQSAAGFFNFLERLGNENIGQPQKDESHDSDIKNENEQKE